MGACMSEQTLTSATVRTTMPPQGNAGGNHIIKVTKGPERIREHETGSSGSTHILE